VTVWPFWPQPLEVRAVDDEVVITQIGLLLTQVHYTRIALEGIERATTRYAGIALSMQAAPGATGAGAPWGSPPMVDGALKVYVVNISDLTAGASAGDVIAGVMGGAGRFLGGFVGGIGGGAIGGLAFPWMLHEAARLTEHLEGILARLGVGAGSSAAAATAAGGSTLADQLASVSSLVRQLTTLFTAASGGPAETQAAGAGSGGGALAASLQPALALAVAATHLVDGLILLLPIVMGSLASLLGHLGRIEVAVLDLVEFGLRGALLLRAAILGTALDAVSIVGRLAATTIGLVVTALDTIIPSVFRLLVTGLETALTALQIVSTGIKNLVDSLMSWLRDGLGSMLIFIGNLRVFRLVEHLAQIAPAVLAAIARLMDKPLSRSELRALDRAAAIPLPAGSGAPSIVPPVTPAPDVVALALPAAARRDLIAALRTLGTSFAAETHTSLSALQGAAGGIGTSFRATVDGLDAHLGTEIQARAAVAGTDIAALSQALNEARAAARERPATGLEAIATAYESWLGTGGLNTLLRQIDDHFRTAPLAGSEVATSVPGRTVRAVLADQSDRRVVVQIDEVVLDLGPEPAHRPAALVASGGFDPEQFHAWQQEFADRGGLVPS
jgi:hypothetical protein